VSREERKERERKREKEGNEKGNERIGKATKREIGEKEE
jgi:hypothetical protein